jgi:peptidoglycan/LPS O-acetylase OafA/YrhL
MVDLFFILSGFVMARTYGDAFRRGFTMRAYAGFLEARLARVYPLYAAVTVIVFLLTTALAIGYPVHKVRALWINLLLIQNLGSGLFCDTCSEKLILPGWSISTEAAAYLLFPALAGVALFGRRASAACLVALCALMIVALAFLPFTWLNALDRRGPLDISGGAALWSLMRCLAEFSIGLVLWRVTKATPSRRPAASWIDAVLAAGIAGCWFVPNSDLLLVMLFTVLIWRLATGETWLTRALQNRAPYRAGEWSYAIYLLHWPALMVMPFVFPFVKATHVPHAWTLTLAGMALLTILLAAAAYQYFEKPARRTLRELFHRRRKSIALEPSAP